MACRESGGSKILLCFGLILVASFFCHSTRLTKLKALDKLRGNSSDLHHGRLLIGQHSLRGAKLKTPKATKNLLDVDTDYQADMEGWGESKKPKGQGDGVATLKPDNAAVDRLLKMEPKVECTGDSMKLQVQDAASTPGSLFFVDRGSRLSPLPLSKLPPSCGYTIRSTRRDLVLVAPYDGCFVVLEEDSYVLPLRWWGLPVRMSCPLMRQSSPNPPMVTCHAEGMVVKVEWAVSVAKIKVKLNGDWEPLMKASPRCGFSVVAHPEGVVISVRYAPCLEGKDGMYTLEVAGDGETKISCPSLSPAQPEPTKSPAKGSKPQTETPSKGVYPAIPSYNSALTRAPEPTPNPAQDAVPQVPVFPQNPEVPIQKPNQGPKDINQPQLPYLPFYPNFFYPYPANPDTKPATTVQPAPHVTKKNDGPQSQQTVPPAKPAVTPEGQVPQPFIPLPFYPWPAQPEVPVEKEPPVQPPATQQPNDQVKQTFYPSPFYVKPPNPDGVPQAHRPVLKPLPTTSPVVKTTKGQIWQPFFQFPYYPQPPKPQTPPAQPPGKLEEPFLPNPQSEEPPQPEVSFYPWPPQSPASVAPKLEPPYPLYPEKTLPEQPAPPKPPVSEEPQGHAYQPFYPYPFYSPFLPEGSYWKPVPPTQQTPTPAPKGQVQQPLTPLQPETSKPKAPENVSPSKPSPAAESKEPQQPEVPQGQVHQPFYLHPQPEPEKPTAVPKPPQPEAPQGQVHQPFYPYPFYPQPEPEKPTAVPKPPQPEAPQGQIHQPFYLHPQPEPEKLTTVPKPPQPEAPQGQVHQPFYPYPFYPQPEPENQPTAVPKPPQPEAPQGQVHQPFYPYPFYPQPEPEKPTAVPKPPQPEAPQGQVHQPFYPYPFYPQPEPEKPTAVPKPPQPEAPQGQVHQPFYPYPFYPQPVPEKPTAVPKPPQPEAPQSQVHQPFYPYPFYPQPEPEKPTTVPKPPQPETPQGQVHQPFYPYPFYPQPEPEKPATVSQPEAPQGQVPKPSYLQSSKIPGAGTNGNKVPTEQPPAVKPPEGQVHWLTLPPATSMQQLQQVTTPASDQNPSESVIPQPSNGGIVPQGHQPDSPYMPPVYCPKFCPSGFSNCCPQIAFHQHLHHIVPAGLGSKDTPPIYSGLPFLPSVAYSGFGNGLGSYPLPQKPTEAMTMQAATSALFSSQSLPSGNEQQPHLQPPDGNPTALTRSNPSKPTNPELIYPYLVPNSLYPNWQYLPQNQSPAHYNVPSKPQSPDNEQVNPVVQYEPYNIQHPKQQNGQLSAGDMNNPSGFNFKSFIGQYPQWQPTSKWQNKSTVKEPQPSNEKSSDTKGQTHPKVQSERDHLLVPYYMLQDAQAPTYNNASQPSVSDSKKSAKYEPAVHTPKSYVLLQHGPPGREPNSFNESLLPFRDLVLDANFLAQNLARHKRKPQHPQILKPPQEKSEHHKWVGEGMSNPLPGNTNYMPWPSESGLPLVSSGPHFVTLPQDPSLSAAHLKPKFLASFKDFWKTRVGSGQRIPPHVPGNAFQQWSSAADHQD